MPQTLQWYSEEAPVKAAEPAHLLFISQEYVGAHMHGYKHYTEHTVAAAGPPGLLLKPQ